jgi:hypothetical protein
MCLDDAVAAFNPAKRINGKTMWRDAPPDGLRYRRLRRTRLGNEKLL